MIASLRKTLWQSIDVVAPMLVLIAAIALRWADPQFMQDLRLQVFDQYQRIMPRPYHPQWQAQTGTVGVGIVDVDEASLARYGQWPWPRDLIARLLGELQQQGAAGVAVDMVFAEPDRTSLDVVVPRLGQIKAYAALREQFKKLQAQDHTLTSNDDFLAATLRQLPTTVLGFSFTNRKPEREPALKKGVIYAGSNPYWALPAFSGATANLAVLESAAAGIGSINVGKDSDGLIRRVPLVFALGDSEQARLYPSLVAEVLRVVQGESQSVRLKSADASGESFFGGGSVGIVKARIGAIEIPTDESGQVSLWDSGHQPQRYIPAWQVLERQVDPVRLEGQILFLGTSAPGLADLRSTPLESVIPGVEIHAQIAEQILSQTFLNRPDYSKGLELVLMSVLGLVLILAIRRLRAIVGAALGLVMIAAALGFSWYAFTELRLLLDPLYVAACALAVYLVASIFHFARSEADKRHVRSAFGRYLSPALVEQLARNPEKLRLGGEMREMTLLFCDIRGFTTISEQFDPPGLTRFINAFLTPMTETILAHGGTIDKYIGDCIMAFWNAPLDVPDHPASACRATLQMFARLQVLNAKLELDAEREQRTFIPIKVGAGLNSGPVCVGNMGSDMRFDYSVLGDAVNLASRLESQSKNYAVDIVIGANTESAIRGDFATLELDFIKVKGKLAPVRIHALMGDKSMLESKPFQQQVAQHQEMLKAYNAQNWHECVRFCQALAIDWPELSGFYGVYLARAADFRANPPGVDWDGVYVATSK